MEHFDFIRNSNYIDQHMCKPANFTDVKAGQSMRLQAKVQERKTRRGEQFNQNRNITFEPEKKVSKQTDSKGIDSKSQERFKQLLQWKAEKEKKKKAAASVKPKPFIVSVVRPPLASFKSPTPVKKLSNKNNVPAVSDRVTRSGRLVGMRPNIQTKPKEFKFAPENAKFHPPHLKATHNIVYGPKSAVPKSIPVASRKPEVQQTRAARNNKQRGRSGGNEDKTSKNEIKMVKARVHQINPVPEGNKNAMEREMEAQVNRVKDKSPKSKKKCSPVHSLEICSDGSSMDSLKTPPKRMTPEQLKNEISNMSPFVTMSRGKRNVRKEMLTKLKDGCLSDDSNDQKSAEHFRKQLDSEIIRLRQICAEWQSYNDENESIIPQNEQDLIFQAIGQTNLLISKKFEQFRGLVQRCEDRVLVEGEGLVTPTDLQGFWDMVFMQVENLDVRFNSLMELRQNGWVPQPVEEVLPSRKAAPRARRAHKPQVRKGNTKIREMIEAARKAAAGKLASAGADVSVSAFRSAGAPQGAEPSNRTFDAGFFKVHSPMKECMTATTTPSKNTSLLKGVLSSEARRMSSKKSTPSALAMLRASRVAKRVSSVVHRHTPGSPESAMPRVNLDATPARSILKTPLTNRKAKGGEKSIKVVLFTQEDEEDNTEESQMFEKLVFFDEPVDNKISGGVSHITEKLDLFAIVTPNVEEVRGAGAAGRRGRRKLSRQSAVVPDDVENVPPVDVNTEHPHERTGRYLPAESKRITRSQHRGDTLTTSQGPRACLYPADPNARAPDDTPKKTPRRTSLSQREVSAPSEIGGDLSLWSLAVPTSTTSSLREHSTSCQTDLISFDSPILPTFGGRTLRRRSARLASVAND